MKAFVQPAVIMSPLLKMIHSIVNLSFQKVLSLQSWCISGHLLTLRHKKGPPLLSLTGQLPCARTYRSLVCTTLVYSMVSTGCPVCIEDKQFSQSVLLVSLRASDCEL